MRLLTMDDLEVNTGGILEKTWMRWFLIMGPWARE